MAEKTVRAYFYVPAHRAAVLQRRVIADFDPARLQFNPAPQIDTPPKCDIFAVCARTDGDRGRRIDARKIVQTGNKLTPDDGGLADLLKLPVQHADQAPGR